MFKNFSTIAAGATAQTLIAADSNRTKVIFQPLSADTWILIGQQKQVETATFAGAVTVAGNMSVVVTSSGMTGSPITLSVPVAVGDGATELAQKARAAMRANAVINARFEITSGNDGPDVSNLVVVKTKVAATNDATLNVASADGTSTGVTAAASSANTFPGAIVAIVDQCLKILAGNIIEINKEDGAGELISIVSATTGDKYVYQYI